MPPALMMVVATMLFATMGVCVKLASAHYTAGEMVFYRSLIGAVAIAGFVRWRGGSLRTAVPAMHFARSASGVVSLGLWFHALGGLPLATAVTLNYMSSVWMALFVLGGAVLADRPAPGSPGRRSSLVDGRLVTAVLVGFAGVALVLRPTIGRDQLWDGLLGLASGVLAAMAYFQVIALGRSGEPEVRVVFYFCVGGIVGGAATMPITGVSPHGAVGVALLVAIGLLAAVAQVLMTLAYTRGRTLVNATLQYLGILFSYVYGLLLFDDDLTATAVAGIALIVGAGVATTLLREASPLPDDARRGRPSDL